MAEETTVEETDEALEAAEEFDPDRAMATIKAQREEEKRLKAALAEARKAEEELQAIKSAEQEAQKSLEEKVKDREAKIADLEAKIAERDVKEDFARKAGEVGISDIELAYLAAKEQGLLGEADPESGDIEGHNLDKLLEMYPALQAERTQDFSDNGGAGVRKATQRSATPGTLFNDLVRQAAR